MSTPEAKLEEFKEIGLTLSGRVAGNILKANAPLETLANAFALATGEDSELLQSNIVRQVRAGIVDPSQVSVRVNGVDASAYTALVQASDAKRASESHLFLITLGQLNDQIDRMRERADEMAASLEENYGESWREDLALKILDADEIPQREEGESLADYRQRVEDALVDEMIDEDGNIKDEYRDNPETRDHAEYAKERWLIRQAEIEAQELIATHNDPEATVAERSASREAASQAAVRLAKHGSNDEDTIAEMDAEMDAKTDQRLEAAPTLDANSFMSMTGQN